MRNVIVSAFCIAWAPACIYSNRTRSRSGKNTAAGIATATISYIQDFMFPLRTIVDSISSVKSVRGVKNRIIAVIEGRRKIIYEETGFKRAIRLNHVRKKYEDFSIDDFSYTFEKGKKYAIIGPSGTGKSTLVKMIVQEIKQDSGDIYIDDKIAEYDVCNTLIKRRRKTAYRAGKGIIV